MIEFLFFSEINEPFIVLSADNDWQFLLYSYSR